MEKESRKTKRTQNGEKMESSFSKVAKNEDPIEGTMKLKRMSEDASVLFSHFPEEIWLLITDKVTDSSSLDSLMQASPVFRRLLLPRRVEFLFPQVWKVLGVKYGEVYSYDFDGMFPIRGWYINDPEGPPRFTKILTLRLVCKSWCRGVDEFYQNLPGNKNYRMDGEIKEGYPEKRHKCVIEQRMGEWTRNVYISKLEDANKFVAHFDRTHFEGGNQRSPIINRKINMTHGHDEDRSRGFFSFLSKYGRHFWYCELYFYSFFPTVVESYTELKEMLELLPNLKTFKVRYTSMESQTHPVSIDVLHPFPKLRQLEFLSLTDFPTSIFKGLLSANTHISMLEVQGDDVQEGYDIYSFPMPNLKQLSMKYFSKLEFENLNKLEKNWALEKIYLDFRHCPALRLSEIFSLLENKWATTLKNVGIYFPPTTADHPHINVMDNVSPTTTLNLPNVQRLTLTSREIFSLDLILPMKSLQCLEVRVVKIPKSDAIDKQLRLLEQKQVIQFVGFFEKLEESNIWNIFPDLKSFRVGDADLEDTSQATGCWSNGKINVTYGRYRSHGPQCFHDLWFTRYS